MSLQEPDYLDLNKANGKLDVKTSTSDDAKSDSNIPFHRGIDIPRPASTDGPLPQLNNADCIQALIQDHYHPIQIFLLYRPCVVHNLEIGLTCLPQWTISP